jgi:hypothetical protein
MMGPNSGPGGAGPPRGGWPSAPEASWSVPPAEVPQDVGDESSPSPPAEGATGEPAGAVPSLIGAASTSETTSSVPSVSAAVVPTPGKGSAMTTEPEPGNSVALNPPAAARLAGLPANGGKEPGLEPGSIVNSPVGPGGSSPPPRFPAVGDADTIVAPRLLSPGESSMGDNQPGGIEPGQLLKIVGNDPRSALKGRPPIRLTLSARDNHGDENGGALPGPASADLLATALPFDRASLDRAIDQFFQQFEEWNHGESVKPGAARILLYSLAIATTFAALDIVRRRWRQGAARDEARIREPLAPTGQMGFPELPGNWSSRLS